VPLLFLLICLPRSDLSGHATALMPIVDRFSAMSLTTVVLIGTSGVINSWPLIGPWSNLTSTAYGQTLLTKVGLFLAMVFVGAINLFKVRPSLARAIDAGLEPNARRSLRWLRLSVSLEIVLGIAVLLAAGLLGVLQPATESCCSVTGN
jgi:putative copper resistance protein D